MNVEEMDVELSIGMVKGGSWGERKEGEEVIGGKKSGRKEEKQEDSEGRNRKLGKT